MNEKRKILVVDDENYILHILDFSLGAEGYEVITAEDGEEAILRAKEDRPDLVVLDVMMPKMDGFEACRQIKRDPDLSATPVILLSARGRDTDQKQGLEAGADDYITKPFSPGRLVDRIHGLLSA
ncbi:MAG: response regulator [Gemmatimonadota bacterium]|jgi:two-component system alkaline phosphatase synthesis response regulator PhoP|nr:response regulator [Gemmatimonadota bacterium]MDP6529632.1 response regulator [Gemmatimonadota bacterium]MDP6803146.1 response regulator [Gemmatimonadota bacterium]MDP7030685.1 response regulator [Gemmatimonadota bacterium]